VQIYLGFHDVYFALEEFSFSNIMLVVEEEEERKMGLTK
jgi:hypothetical protein